MITEQDIVFIECLFELKDEGYDTSFVMNKLKKYAKVQNNNSNDTSEQNVLEK